MITHYYDPLTARFTQPDTIVPNHAAPQSLNRYSYVYNNPATLNDPTGHCPECLGEIFGLDWDAIEAAGGGGGGSSSATRPRPGLSDSYSADATAPGDVTCLATRSCGPGIATYHDHIMLMAFKYGINPGLLAMVIDHEGGNVRMFDDLWRTIEMIGPYDSVGIGNVQPQNAFALDPTLTEDRARSLLIWNDEFNIEVAAFVLAERQQWVPAQHQSNHNLFLAYAANEDLVRSLNALSWDVHASNNEVLIRRSEVHFPAARNHVLIGAEYFGMWGGLICAAGGSCGTTL